MITRAFLLISLLIIAGCSSTQLPDQAEIDEECCADADEPQSAISPEDSVMNITEMNNSQQQNITQNLSDAAAPTESSDPEEDALPKTLAEEYYKLYEKNVKFYEFSYYHKGYGLVYIWDLKNVVKFGFKEKFGEIKDDTLMVTEYRFDDLHVWDKYFRKHDENDTIVLVDYVWYVDGQYKACLIDELTFLYTNSSCLIQEGKQVIWENLEVTDFPKPPIEYLKEEFGRRPVKIEKGFKYKEWLVDKITYQNYDDTLSVLYLHQKYGIPTKVDIVKDGKTVETVTFDNLVFNRAELITWREAFMNA